MAAQALEDEKYQLVLQLTNPDTREGALLELSKRRESFGDLAPILWHSFGTMAALLQEIVSIYPLLSPPSLTAHASNRVCNALALLQCVASHPETRRLFLQAQHRRLEVEVDLRLARRIVQGGLIYSSIVSDGEGGIRCRQRWPHTRRVGPLTQNTSFFIFIFNKYVFLIK